MCKKVRDLVYSDRRIQVEEIAQALGISMASRFTIYSINQISDLIYQISYKIYKISDILYQISYISKVSYMSIKTSYMLYKISDMLYKIS